LHSVPAWRHAYSLRVLVFVEYESEVEEEQARVKALLDKLRIEAEVLVFWLACGALDSYEFIINGRCDDVDAQIMVNDVLKDEEWWDELQMLRGRSASTSASHDLTTLAHIIESTSGRPGVYNPHAAPETAEVRRRSSLVDLLDMSSRPTMSRLSRLGINIGIHTTHISDNVLDDSSATDVEGSIDGKESSSGSDSDLDSDGSESAASDGDIEDLQPVRRPLLRYSTRRKSHGDAIMTSSQRRKSRQDSHKALLRERFAPDAQSYGTMSSRTLTEAESSQQNDLGTKERKHDEQTGPATSDILPRNPSPRSISSIREAKKLTEIHTANPEMAGQVRPSFSRQSSTVRFSSRTLPETRVTVEGTSGPTIMFADADETPRAEQGTFSRQSSTVRFSSRPTPDMRVSDADGFGPSITFADQEYHSRKASAIAGVGPIDRGTDGSFNMPEILEAYRRDNNFAADDEGSPYSTQGVALSFNDLPSRAQHLILNELMRQNSGDTAVVFSTLPIPAEGTCQDDRASVQYLSGVELLCNGLPPVLLVLSNNMTVTVSL
jgi:solute carrier family 12 (potassium/chloride transporters), member 9